jgi:dolichyl-phosphate beta-glucosyltransferase
MRPVSRLTLVVPCYNEEKRLDAAAFRGVAVDGHDIDFLFVNDGSRDGTLRLLESLRDEDPKRFAVLNLERNSGKAEAVRRGFIAAMERDVDYIGFWDADLATPFSELPKFLSMFETRSEAEMVFGARIRLLGRAIERHALRHYLGRISATLIATTLGLAIYDTQCGAKVFRARVVDDLFGQPFVARWIFDAEIIARFLRARGRAAAVDAIYELPLDAWLDVKGTSISITSYLKSLWDLWRIDRIYHPRSR